MRSSNLLALAASLSSASAAFQGFNYGATKSDGTTVRVQSDFQSLFQTAKNLVGTSGFTSARLYTTVQGGTASDPTSAIPAAIAEGTSLLLGLWASGGQTGMTNEITALKAAISQYGDKFTKLVAGISVGSEDLYRISPTGIAAKSGYGAEPSELANYISQVRSAIAGTALSSSPVGHVDTWTAWVNGSNNAVIDACDFIGMDAYPYFQSTQANSIENGAGLFNDALGATKAAVGGKPVWITETGWPVSGSVAGSAQPSTQNAKTYWDAVGCPNFGTVNTWWYTLEDTDNNASPNPSFGITTGTLLSNTPLFDLSCANVQSSSSSKSSSATATGSAASTLVSSASTVATNIVSSGGALSPTQPGNGVGNTTATGSAVATATATGAGTGTGSNATVPAGTGSATKSSTAPAQATTNAAAGLTGSVVGAVGALIFAVAAL
jgi:glucan endo-1,3-beta-D-glucosidase